MAPKKIKTAAALTADVEAIKIKMATAAAADVEAKKGNRDNAGKAHAAAAEQVNKGFLMISGVGLGFRDEIADDLLFIDPQDKPKFVEIAPENWIGIGGVLGKALSDISQHYPILCHGLSLSLGSPEPLDLEFMKKLKLFLDRYQVTLYSEHLSYCKCDNAHLYDLLPVPFNEEAVFHIAKRIRFAQEFLERTIHIENISYYTTFSKEIEEAAFINAILKEANCKLLLDVNNVYVNSFNHKYDPYQFIDALDLEKVGYLHVAGHLKVSEDLIIDTHGENIADPVFALFDYTVEKLNPLPVLLERDGNFGDFPHLLKEIKQLEAIATHHWSGAGAQIT